MSRPEFTLEIFTTQDEWVYVGPPLRTILSLVAWQIDTALFPTPDELTIKPIYDRNGKIIGEWRFDPHP
jgi:hypothetical protein